MNSRNRSESIFVNIVIHVDDNVSLLAVKCPCVQTKLENVKAMMIHQSGRREEKWPSRQSPVDPYKASTLCKKSINMQIAGPAGRVSRSSDKGKIGAWKNEMHAATAGFGQIFCSTEIWWISRIKSSKAMVSRFFP
jgi:hypothetical protein